MKNIWAILILAILLTGFVTGCVEGWEVWGVWEGVLISDLLDMAHVREEGEYVLFECQALILLSIIHN